MGVGTGVCLSRKLPSVAGAGGLGDTPFEHRRWGVVISSLEYCHKLLIGLPASLSNPFPTLQLVWSFKNANLNKFCQLPCFPLPLEPSDPASYPTFRLSLLSQSHCSSPDELGLIPISNCHLYSAFSQVLLIWQIFFFYFPSSPLPAFWNPFMYLSSVIL